VLAALSCACSTACRSSASPTAHTTDTDFGAERGLVDAGDAVLAVRDQAPAGDRVPAVEEAEQVLGGHLAGEAEPLREAAEGAGRSRLRLAVVGDVVVPEIGVNLVEVVGDGAEGALELGLANGHLSRSGRVLYVVLGFRLFELRLSGCTDRAGMLTSPARFVKLRWFVAFVSIDIDHNMWWVQAGVGHKRRCGLQ